MNQLCYSISLYCIYNNFDYQTEKPINSKIFSTVIFKKKKKQNIVRTMTECLDTELEKCVYLKFVPSSFLSTCVTLILNQLDLNRSDGELLQHFFCIH